MFHSARIRLTCWYLLILAFISLSFSAIIYRDFTSELEHSYVIAEYRIRGLPIPATRQKARLLLQEEFNISKKNVLLRLLFVNGVILGIAGIGGYFLAGKTLQPIELMVEEQKRFVADASHELRTPLTALKTEIEVMLRSKKFKIGEFRQLLKSNLQEVDKMKTFTDYLLSLSRYEVNGKSLPMEKVHIKTILRQAIERNMSLAKAKKIKLNLAGEDIIILGNEISLIELFSILVNNAIKYSDNEKNIGLSISKERRTVVITVKDEGYGITKEDIPHIFDRFYRADSSRSKISEDGFGLGLSIAKSIVDAHGGEIKVESQIGLGSTFKTTFLL